MLSSFKGSSTYQLITVLPDYWGGNQSRHSTSMFHTISAGAFLPSCNFIDAFPQENIHTYHQPNAGLTGTSLISAGQFQPYKRFCAQLSEHRNMEAGTLTLMLSHFPYTSHSMQQPSGGVTSETVADTEKIKTITEEDKVPVSSFYCSYSLCD